MPVSKISAESATDHQALLSPDQTKAFAELIEAVRAGWDEAPPEVSPPEKKARAKRR